MHVDHVMSCDIQVYLHDSKLTEGQLMVELIECSHLIPVQSPGQLFCSLQLGECTLLTDQMFVQSCHH